MLTRSLSATFDAVYRPATGGGTHSPPASGLLGLTDATSKAAPTGDWPAGWDATPSNTARHVTTITLFITLSQHNRTPTALDVPCAASIIRPILVGLSGTFDIDLMYLPDLPFGGVALEKLALDPKFAGRAGLVTSLREQLGLKLEPTQGRVEVLVIDRAERPTEN